MVLGKRVPLENFRLCLAEGEESQYQLLWPNEIGESTVTAGLRLIGITYLGSQLQQGLEEG
jgi:hypothetical protein